MNLKIFILMLSLTKVLADQKCASDVYKSKFHNGTEEFNVLSIWYPIPFGSSYYSKLCSSKTGLPMQRSCDVNESSEYGKWNEIPENTILINCTIIETSCKREEFQHYYIHKNEKVEIFNNHWIPEDMNKIGELEELCLDTVGLPFTRKCLYNATTLQAQWETINEQLRNVSCKRDLEMEQITFLLKTLYKAVKKDDDNKININRKKVMDHLIQLLSIPKSADTAENLEITSDILKILNKDVNQLNIIPEVINLTNKIMNNTNSNTIQTMEKVNATRSFLKTIDNYFDKMAQIVVATTKCETFPGGTYAIQSEFVTLFYINPLCSNISGVAVYNGSDEAAMDKYIDIDNSTAYNYRFVYLDQSLDHLINESHLYLASYLPLSLWQNMTSTLPEGHNDTILKIIIYKNDILFPKETEMELNPDKNVLDISITNYIGDLPDVIPIIFSYNLKERNSKNYPVCGYWNDSDSNWITHDVNTTYKHPSHVICHSKHLGKFAVLITDNSIINKTILEYVSLVGCALSFIALICIWMAALFAKKLCSEGRIALNISVILMMIMVLFLLYILPDIRDAIFNGNYSLYCKLAGGFLQYNVISLFLWLALFARVQYINLSSTYGEIKHSRSIWYYSLIAYGIPLIPSGLVGYFDPETYMLSEAAIHNGTSGICYPSGRSLEYGVALPIIIIALFILGLYIYMLCTISSNRNATTKLCLSLTMFLLLAITWIFGIMAHLITSSILNHLFFITLPLQGLILLMYVIAIEKSAWFKLCCWKKTYSVTAAEKNREMHHTP